MAPSFTDLPILLRLHQPDLSGPTASHKSHPFLGHMCRHATMNVLNLRPYLRFVGTENPK